MSYAAVGRWLVLTVLSAVAQLAWCAITPSVPVWYVPVDAVIIIVLALGWWLAVRELRHPYPAAHTRQPANHPAGRHRPSDDLEDWR